MITAGQLSAIYTHCPMARAQLYASALADAMLEFDISTPLRMAMFLAQVGHESGELQYVREIWGPTQWQLKYENNPQLGNDAVGDGKRFLGRGLIQVTGKANYRACSSALFGDDRLLAQPELLETPQQACRSAGWFWKSHSLNELADAGNFVRITKVINPAMLGFDQRSQLLKQANAVLGVNYGQAQDSAADHL